ncbi:MAG: hypothetical protein GY772_29255 [bacterium]|nr:hypothetical protein [bacterium]
MAVKCKYGRLKCAVRNASGGRRICKRKPTAKRGRAKCKHGKLKNPVGRRVCKKR